MFMEIWTQRVLYGVYCPDPVSRVAGALGVHRSTLWRWRQHKEYVDYFQRSFERASGHALKCIHDRWEQERQEMEAEEKRLLAAMEKGNVQH